MKKKQINLQKKLLLDKQVLIALLPQQQQRIAGGAEAGDEADDIDAVLRTAHGKPCNTGRRCFPKTR